MISILIPVYNCNVNELATTLSRQLTALDVAGEIILLDDASAIAYRQLNAATASLPMVQYLEGSENMGRIRIRQQLAEKAAFDWMLFLDCDSTVLSDQFLQNYLQDLPSKPTVVVGGRIYTSQPPENCSLHLHWLYGTKREAIDVQQRNQHPYYGFMSNNFVIHRSVFKQLSFVKSWNGYGHEDSWIGIQLEKLKASVIYIDNAVRHDGLETADSFLQKSEQALQNLHRLQQLTTADEVKRHVRLFRIYSRLRSVGMLWLPKGVYGILRNAIEKNLQSCNPSLFYFDLYRLDRFINISSNSVTAIQEGRAT